MLVAVQQTYVPPDYLAPVPLPIVAQPLVASTIIELAYMAEAPWTPVNRADPNDWEDDLSDLIVVEIRDESDTVKWSNTYSGDEAGFTMTNADLVAALGSEATFKLRAFTRSGTSLVLDSRTYDEATVTLV